jgi:hypothetical protein
LHLRTAPEPDEHVWEVEKAAQQSIRSSANVPSGDELKIIRHVTESLQDNRVFEFTQLRTSLPRERDGSGVRLIARHHFSTPDSGRGMGTLDRFGGREAFLDAHEWQGNVVDHHGLQNWMPDGAVKNKKRTLVKAQTRGEPLRAVHAIAGILGDAQPIRLYGPPRPAKTDSRFDRRELPRGTMRLLLIEKMTYGISRNIHRDK